MKGIILNPALSNQWRFLIRSCKNIMLQTESLSLNLKDNELTVLVEQPANSDELFDEIMTLTKEYGDPEFAIQFMNGGDEVRTEIRGLAKMKSHTMNLSYEAPTTTVKHVLVFSVRITSTKS